MARIIDFFDGAQSETTPTIGNIVASNLVKYTDDAEYEANEQDSPQTGNIYYNTTLDLIRYYNGVEWISLVDESSTQTIENKTVSQSNIDADDNVIENIENENIKAGAAIDATKISSGNVDNDEFDTLDGINTGQTIQDQFDGKQDISEKGQPDGYASLDSGGKVPAGQLPSYIDDVEEYADLASFPVTGETGKIYVALDNNKTYRWSGSIYVEISPSEVNSVNSQTGVVSLDSDDVPEGPTNKYANGSINTHSDVDTTTVPPAPNDALVWNGSEWVPGTPVSASAAKQVKNYLYNAEMRLFQRQDPTTTTDYSDGDYHADRWIGLTSGGGADFRVRRLPAEANKTLSGDKVENTMDITQQSGSSQRMGIVQFLPLADCLHLRGKEVTLQFEAASVAGNVELRAGIVEWEGTADGFNKDIVDTWAATPTLITDAIFSNTPADLGVTETEYNKFTITATLGTDFNNLGVFIWTPNTQGTSNRFQITKVALIENDTDVFWSQISKSKERDQVECQLFLNKSYDFDTAPGLATDNGLMSVATRAASSTVLLVNTAPYVRKMFKPPSVTTWSREGTLNAISYTLTGGTLGQPGSTIAFVGESAASIGSSAASGLTPGSIYNIRFHYMADAEIGV